MLPYSHYFHSGFTGSGVAILSAWPIVDTLMHRYSLNGFAHHIHRGDWFGGKIVGMVQVRKDTHLINVYSTHLHAEYDRDNDLYHPHRITQAWELARFVGHTSGGADLSIVTGDLNMEPSDVGMRVILDNARLTDAWLAAGKDSLDPKGMTCDLPGNLYGYRGDLTRCPNGKRIDYILFNASPGVELKVRNCSVTLDKVPEDPSKDMSDHQAVEAEFSVKMEAGGGLPRLNSVTTGEEKVSAERRSVLEKAVDLMEEGRGRVWSDRLLYWAASAALLIAALYTIDLELGRPAFAVVAIPGRFVLTLLIGFCVWHALIILPMEDKALRAAEEAINTFLRHKTE